MAYTRSSAHHRSLPSPGSPAVSRKRYLFRRSIARRSLHVPSLSSPTNQDHRPVLVLLLHSRDSVCKASDRNMVTRDSDQVTRAGAKRKRSSNENVLVSDQGISRQKRLRTTTRNYFSDETDIDLDTLVSSSFTAGDEIEENEGEEGESESSSMCLKTDIVSCLSTNSIVFM